MNMTIRYFVKGAMAFALFAVAFMATGQYPASLRAAQGDNAVTPKQLARKYDYIKVCGDFLRPFNGVPIKKVGLLAFRDGKMTPIPFQIDERDRKGRLIMTSGKIAGRDDDNGALDSNDELVFLVQDMGDRSPKSKRNGMMEIEVTDPRYPKKHAWAYLVYVPAGKTPRSNVDYVKYDPAKEQISSRKYVIGYRKGFMFYNDLSYTPAAGGNGQDFIDRIKVRFHIEFLKGRMNFVRTEDAVRAEVQGWIDGPVRVVQATKNHVKLFDIAPPISFNSMSEYYPHLMASPIIVRFPFDIGKLVKRLGISRITVDVLGDHFGMVGGRGYTNLSPDGFDYTGKMSRETWEKMPKKGIVWGYATKKGVGTWFPRVVFPDPMYQFNNYYLTDDVNYDNPPDDVKGEIGGGIRLVMTDYPSELLDQMGQQSFMLTFETYFAKAGLTPPEAREWLDIQDYPLLVDVHAADDIVHKGMTGGKVGEGPPWEGGADGVITDILDRKIPLKKIAFFIGDVNVDARSYFGGEKVDDATFHKIPISNMRSMENYCVEYDPHTKTRMAIFAKTALKDGTVWDMMSCRSCGWGGADDSGRVIYLSNVQIKRIDFQPVK